MKQFDLNIEKVLEDWEVHHAVREVLANAIDEQVLTATDEIKIFRDAQGKLHIRDFGRGLKYEHLTQNENKEKLSHPDRVIGKFGVGLKDALATFNRKCINIIIKSKFGDITIIKSSKHDFEDVITLHAAIEPPSEPEMRGTEFILDGISVNDLNNAKNYFLKFSNEIVLEKTSYGEVLSKDGNPYAKARIYINGLKVAEEDNFLFSYNITSATKAMRKALNRERIDVGRTAYVDRVKSILLSCHNEKVRNYLMTDLRAYESGTMHDELEWSEIAIHTSKLLNSADKVVFSTVNELVSAKDMIDRARNDGYEIVPIQDNVKAKLSGTTDFAGNPVRDVNQYASEWNNSFQFEYVNENDLSVNELRIFHQTEALLSVIGGWPRSVKEILLSNTMRYDVQVYSDASGLWDPENKRIIIKRDQLNSLETYTGTLLHEMAHARSGAVDSSIQFEQELTVLLGLVAKGFLTNLD